MDCKEFVKTLENTNKRSHGELVGRLIIDAKKLKWFPVPGNMNHPDFVSSSKIKVCAELTCSFL